jgi:hypothetical protein
VTSFFVWAEAVMLLLCTNKQKKSRGKIEDYKNEGLGSKLPQHSFLLIIIIHLAFGGGMFFVLILIDWLAGWLRFLPSRALLAAWT